MQGQGQEEKELGKAAEGVVSGIPFRAHFWPVSAEGTRVVAVRNRLGCRIAVKAKCSDNSVYKLSQMHTFIQSGRDALISVLRKGNSPDKADKLVLHWTRVTNELATNPAMEWTDGRSPEGLLCIPLLPVSAPPQPFHLYINETVLRDASNQDWTIPPDY